MIDVDSFVDYFIINELSSNADAGNYSTYIYKGTDNLYRMCVWDFNNACDNYMEDSHDGTGFSLYGNYLYFMLLKEPDFVEAVIARYRSLRQSIFSEEYLMQYVDETVQFLGEAVERNYEVWGYSFQPDQVEEYEKLQPDSRNPDNYEEAVTQLKNFLIKRGQWLDQYIENLRQYSHESVNKKYNH